MTNKNCITVSKSVQCSSLTDGVSLREAAGLVPWAEPKQEANQYIFDEDTNSKDEEDEDHADSDNDPFTHCCSSRGRAAFSGWWVLSCQTSWKMWGLWQSIPIIIKLNKRNYGSGKIAMQLWSCLWVRKPTVFEWDSMFQHFVCSCHYVQWVNCRKVSSTVPAPKTADDVHLKI